jgi:hypothetical protein
LALVEGWWSQPHPGRFTSGKDLLPIEYEAGLAPGPIWTSAENLVPTKIRSPDSPAHSESLYCLRCPAHTLKVASGNGHMCTTAGYCCLKSLLYVEWTNKECRRVAQEPPLSFPDSRPYHLEFSTTDELATVGDITNAGQGE